MRGYFLSDDMSVIFVLSGLIAWGLAHEFHLFGLHPFATVDMRWSFLQS